MSQSPVVEDRLQALEREVAALKQRLARQDPTNGWLTKVAASMQDEPEFDKVLELGRLARAEQNTVKDIAS